MSTYQHPVVYDKKLNLDDAWPYLKEMIIYNLFNTYSSKGYIFADLKTLIFHNNCYLC